MLHDRCPNCRKADEETFQETESELSDFFTLADSLPSPVKARVYGYVQDELGLLKELLESCKTPEQQSLALSFHTGFKDWGPDDVDIEVSANTSPFTGCRSRHVDLLVRVMNYKGGKDKIVLQVAVLCGAEAGEAIDAEAAILDRECLASGILVFRFTKAEAMNTPGRCENTVERGLERMLTAHRRAGWGAPNA